MSIPGKDTPCAELRSSLCSDMKNPDCRIEAMGELQQLHVYPWLTSLHSVLDSKPQLISHGGKLRSAVAGTGRYWASDQSSLAVASPGLLEEVELPPSAHERRVPEMRRLLARGETIRECLKSGAISPDL